MSSRYVFSAVNNNNLRKFPDALPSHTRLKNKRTRKRSLSLLEGGIGACISTSQDRREATNDVPLKRWGSPLTTARIYAQRALTATDSRQQLRWWHSAARCLLPQKKMSLSPGLWPTTQHNTHMHSQLSSEAAAEAPLSPARTLILSA